MVDRQATAEDGCYQGVFMLHQLGHFEKVYPDYAAGVRAALSEQAKKAKAAG